MKTTLSSFAVMVVVNASTVMLIVPVNGFAHGKGKDVNTLLNKASDYLLGKSESERDGKKGFAFLMEAIIEITPQCSFPADFHKKMQKAFQYMKKTSILAPEGMTALKECYRMINNNREYKLPKFDKIKEAVEIAKKLMVKSRINLKKNNPDAAVKSLMEVAIMVITPVKKK